MHFKMSSAICFNLEQSKNLSSGNGSRSFQSYLKTLFHDRVKPTYTVYDSRVGT